MEFNGISYSSLQSARTTYAGAHGRVIWNQEEREYRAAYRRKV